ncbi:polymorphic toxin-type HINT domain-containing protein [Nonomuraea endophytica]|uniref:RHS repeat-associated protein n=1 Tax=Nonomuraea endophytica TaxID=714136 RepID=A0A7W8EJR7_9ACTN|nr:polymorphic toxin-type HINT domain-containing protein [Nonomuraea endophytica]MBB5081806.1 RHS repeat-associated protein [Nonomuraea endophytica]
MRVHAARRRRASLSRMLRAVLTLVLTAGLLFVPPTYRSAAADAERDRPKPVDREWVVPGKSAAVKPRISEPKAPDPVVNWPAPATAEVDLAAAAVTARKAGAVAAAPAGPSSTGRVKIQTHDRAASQRAGVSGPVITAARTAGPPGKVTMTVDYAPFAEAFGGGFGSRMRLSALPACALTSPDRAECRRAVPLKGRNDSAARTLSADVDLGAEPMVLAVTSAAAGDKGDFGVTSLSPSSTWQVSAQSGDFSWSYPLRVPPVPGGLVPNLAVNYSSAAIDGRTVSSNNQASWVGDGFELSPGYIERKYKSCKDDGVPKDPTYQVEPMDQCWAYDNATLSLGGSGGELIPTGADTWVLAKDNGTKVQRLTGTDADTGNGDDNNEHWRVTTPDGTQYYFGKNRLPGWSSGKPQTNSAWDVPVFGNNSGEPCHKDAFKDSWCAQGWRWNLDYIEDTRGNAVTFYYAKEKNHYGRNLRAADDTPYTRGGYLTSIQYGLRGGNLFPATPPAEVAFTNAERCLAGECGDIGDHPARWPDVPWDMNCNPGTECKDGKGTATPSFWTRKRLTKITTKVVNQAGNGHRDVDSWEFKHLWGIADVDRQLKLTDITHTGHAGPAPITTPPVSFVYQQLANRVDKLGDDVGPFIKERVAAIQNETGGKLDITYSEMDCTPSDLPEPATNRRRCFPTFWQNANGGADPSLDWFHKYVVRALIQTDLTGGGSDMVTRYDYSIGRPAWHYADDDGITPQKFKTWSNWRGYDKVRVISGATSAASGGTPSQTDYWFFQGMHGDRAGPSGGTKTVTLPDGEGGNPTDHESLHGMTLRTVTYDKVDGAPVSKSVTSPWHHQTASKSRPWGTMTANLTGTKTTRTFAQAGSPWQQTRSTVTDFDLTNGTALAIDDEGEVGVPGDEECTRTELTADGSRVLRLAARVITVARRCADTPNLTTDLVADVRSYYDDKAFKAAPTHGEVTKTERAVAATATAITSYQVMARSSYDVLGRPKTVTDAAGLISSTDYSEPHGVTTEVTSTTPRATASDPESAMSTTRVLDPAWGLAIRETNPSGKTTIADRDALGRTSKVWGPGRTKSQVPDNEYQYLMNPGAIVAVGAKTLTNDGGQQLSYTLFDGWLRPRQSQAPGKSGGTKGRIISDTVYNGAGQVHYTFEPYYADGDPQPKRFGAAVVGAVESQVWNNYDGRGRLLTERLLSGNSDGATNELWNTRYEYGDNWSKVIPPSGGTPVTTYTDVHGRTREVHQHRAAGPVVTKFGYNHRGQPDSVTGPGNQVWSYTYDLLGRRVQSDDPDRGVEKVAYDNLDRPVLTTDARNHKIGIQYDGLGRPIAKYDATTASPGTKIAEWVYDTVRKGQLTSSSRIVGGDSYTTQVEEYDNLDRPQRTRVTLPAGEGALAPAGGYVFDTSYNLDGSVAASSSPAVGGLPAENIAYTYDDLGRLVSTKSQLSTYLIGTDYTKTGRLIGLRMQSGAAGKQIDQTFDYEFGTGRLAKATTWHFGMPGTDRSTQYTYQPAGNITQVKDSSRDGVDNQCFRYDELSRLSEAWTQPDDTQCAETGANTTIGGPAPYRATYTYDDTGNRRSESLYGAGPSGGAQQSDRTYVYDPAKAHRLTTVSGAASYAYDASGNTTERHTQGSNQTLTWDAEGELTKVTDDKKGETRFLHTADGERLIRRDKDGTTLYLPGMEVHLAKGATATTARRFVGNAMRTTAGVTYLIGDHQGSAELAINAETGALGQRRYAPFGRLRGAQGEWPQEHQRGFVGGITDASTDLTTLGARSYDPVTGRFISVDSVIQMGDSQQMNGYNYANNNPVTLADPTGLAPCCSGIACTKSLDPPCTKDQLDDDDCEGPCDFNTAKKGLEGGRDAAENERQQQQQIAKRNAVLEALKAAGIGFIKDFLKIEDIKGCFSGSVGKCVSLLLEVVPAKKIGGLIWKLSTRVRMGIKIYKKVQGAVKAARQAIEQLDAKIDDINKKIAALDALIARAAKRSKNPKSAGTSCKLSNSFTPDTKVLLANGSGKRIDQLKPGDKVLATDPETGRTAAKEILATIVGDGTKNLVTITVDTGKAAGDIIATDGHPFWIESEKAWRDAKDLRPGQLLRTAAGTYVQVTAVKSHTTQARVHNLTVADIHTYYVLVGATPVLVHNCGKGADADDADKPKPIHLAMGRQKKGGVELLDNFAASVEAVTWRGEPFRDLFPGVGSPASNPQLTAMMDRVLERGGRISFNLEEMEDVPGVLAGRVGIGGRTTFELQYVCGNAALRAITTFHNGAAPC